MPQWWEAPLPKHCSKQASKQRRTAFKSLEIAGSNPGTERAPKFDLLLLHWDIKIPWLEKLCQEVAAATGKHKVAVHGQKGNACPHVDGVLNGFSQMSSAKGMTAFPCSVEASVLRTGNFKGQPGLRAREMGQRTEKLHAVASMQHAVQHNKNASHHS